MGLLNSIIGLHNSSDVLKNGRVIVDEETRRDYRRDGFITGVEVFSEGEIAETRRAFDRLEDREGREKCQIGLGGLHDREEFIWRLATDGRILDIIEAFIGRDILLLSTHFFCKYPDPQADKFVAWHQDVTYWGLEPPIALTAWVAIDDSEIANGCMRVIPGTHRTGIAPHAKSAAEGNLLSINQEIPHEYVDETRAVDLELEAGQISVHDGHLFHASNPNRSERRRCGLTLRFVPTKVRQAELNSVGTSWQPILVRGEDRFRHFDEIPVPF